MVLFTHDRRGGAPAFAQDFGGRALDVKEQGASAGRPLEVKAPGVSGGRPLEVLGVAWPIEEDREESGRETRGVEKATIRIGTGSAGASPSLNKTAAAGNTIEIWNKEIFTFRKAASPGLSSRSGRKGATLWRIAMLAVMVVWGGELVFAGVHGNSIGKSWLHLVNLPFHEAGHLILRLFGSSFLTGLGGTLGQLLVPLLCMGVLLVKAENRFGGAVCLWWFGENFLDIAPYINDARTGHLPLLGGNFGYSPPYGFHDWSYLLTEMGLLRYDHILARVAHGLGSLLMALAMVWSLRVLLGNGSRLRA